MAIALRSAFALTAFVVSAPLHAQACGTTIRATASGTWNASSSPYCVVEDTDVGDLVIEAGVQVIASPGVVILVSGTLDVRGTGSNPVQFAAANPSLGWRGLHLRNAPPAILRHARIQDATESGIRAEETSLVLNSCGVIDCKSPARGGGVHATGNAHDLTIVDSTIARNDAQLSGGGLYASLGRGVLTVEGTDLLDNTANDNLAAANIRGGGAYVLGTDRAVFRRCEVRNNSCYTESAAPPTDRF